ncbi:MAG: PfkB family carbohydrate kinase, partial [Chloroflexota bacterium]
MTRILVSGLINVETTLRVEDFPIHYEPVRYPFFGLSSTVSGVGYNVAKALVTLGEAVDVLSLIGRDSAEQQVRAALAQDGIPGDYVIADL